MSERLGPQEGYLWAFRICPDGCFPYDDAPLPDKMEATDGWIWAHFGLSDQRARAYIGRAPDLPDPVREVLLGTDCAPRIAFHSGWTFGALPDFERDLQGDRSGPGRLRFAFNGAKLLTTRRHALQVLQDVHRTVQSGAFVPESPRDAFVRLCSAYCDTLEDGLDDLSVRINQVEDQVLRNECDPALVHLSPVRQTLSLHQREIAGLRTAIHRGAARGAENTSLATELRMLMQRVEDVHHEVSALESRGRLIHEEIDTRLNAQTNRTLRTLTIMSTLLMPPTLIVGAFGMNLKGITFGEDGDGFLIVSALCLAVVAVTYLMLRGSRVLR